MTETPAAAGEGIPEGYAANLAALGRVKALAEKWEGHAARLDALAALKEDPAGRAEVAQAAQSYHDCARQLREALS